MRGWQAALTNDSQVTIVSSPGDTLPRPIPPQCRSLPHTAPTSSRRCRPPPKWWPGLYTGFQRRSNLFGSRRKKPRRWRSFVHSYWRTGAPELPQTSHSAPCELCAVPRGRWGCSTPAWQTVESGSTMQPRMQCSWRHDTRPRYRSSWDGQTQMWTSQTKEAGSPPESAATGRLWPPLHDCLWSWQGRPLGTAQHNTWQNTKHG